MHKMYLPCGKLVLNSDAVIMCRPEKCICYNIATTYLTVNYFVLSYYINLMKFDRHRYKVGNTNFYYVGDTSMVTSVITPFNTEFLILRLIQKLSINMLNICLKLRTFKGGKEYNVRFDTKKNCTLL